MEDLFAYKPCEDEDYYKILGCDELSTVISAINAPFCCCFFHTTSHVESSFWQAVLQYWVPLSKKGSFFSQGLVAIFFFSYHICLNYL